MSLRGLGSACLFELCPLGTGAAALTAAQFTIPKHSSTHTADRHDLITEIRVLQMRGVCERTRLDLSFLSVCSSPDCCAAPSQWHQRQHHTELRIWFEEG